MAILIWEAEIFEGDRLESYIVFKSTADSILALSAKIWKRSDLTIVGTDNRNEVFHK
jgi:hypothetical protein